MGKVPPVILVPYSSGQKLLSYARQNAEEDIRPIIFVDFDMVNFFNFLTFLNRLNPLELEKTLKI